jgi:Cu/Ag efflux protein CusF
MTFRKMICITVAGLGLALGTIGCGDSAEPGKAQGVVTDVFPEERKVTLDHEEIPGMMAAMKMDYHLAPDVSLEGITPGTEVDFRAKKVGGLYTVTEMQRR